MKTYSIGRDLNCDIIINDSTDVISRRHALLNITPSGKMTIIDQSSNGTYVNGIRISENVPVPVTRKDIVSLAHVAKLDWSQVPRQNQWVKYAVAAAIAAAVILGIIFGMKYLKPGDNVTPADAATEQTDSTAIKQKEAAKQDSIRNAEKQDSISKARKAGKDSAASAKNAAKVKKTDAPKSQDAKAKDSKDKDKAKGSKDKDKSKQKGKRTMG